jgi:hypothetical protein
MRGDISLSESTEETFFLQVDRADLSYRRVNWPQPNKKTALARAITNAKSARILTTKAYTGRAGNTTAAYRDPLGMESRHRLRQVTSAAPNKVIELLNALI